MSQEPKEPESEQEYGRQFKYAYWMTLDPATGNYEESMMDSEGNVKTEQGNLYEDAED